jgi:phosphate transport system protein
MDPADLTHHISRRYNAELERVRTRLLAMGGLVEEQLRRALTALVAADSALGESVARDDVQVNELEMALDEDCNGLLAIRAPTAGDLRVVFAMIKAVTDLERVGDEAEKVAFIAARLAMDERPSDNYREAMHLGHAAVEMLHDALDAFARMDAAAALEISQRDRLLDEEFEAIQREGIAFMLANPRAIRRALDSMWIARALERIGDHAKNLCEYVVYMVHGDDIRHSSHQGLAQEYLRERSTSATAATLPPPPA